MVKFVSAVSLVVMDTWESVDKVITMFPNQECVVKEAVWLTD